VACHLEDYYSHKKKKFRLQQAPDLNSPNSIDSTRLEILQVALADSKFWSSNSTTTMNLDFQCSPQILSSEGEKHVEFEIALGTSQIYKLGW
jgi:hypothetical protein